MAPDTAGEASLASLWTDPVDLPSRDLFHGVGGPEHAPDPDERYAYVETDTKGWSRGYDVRDHEGLLWSVKLGAEAQPEVVVSRILWAVGYHQPPTYYLPRWTLARDGRDTTQPPGRFRPELPTWKKVGRWSWQRNPFVGTRPFRGLIIINVLFANSDMKNSNTVLYELTDATAPNPRRYVFRDLGSALGHIGKWPIPGSENDLHAFEKQRFVTGVDDGRVKFDYGWAHRELLRDITPADVRWACALLARLSDEQWRDAFRAAQYDDATATRYIRVLRERIAQAQELPG